MGKSRRLNSQRKATNEWITRLYKDELSPVGIAQGIALSIVIALLFYRSWYGLIVAVAVVPFWQKIYASNQKAKRKNAMEMEFKEYMILVANSLQAGYSLERALVSGEDELCKLMPKGSILKEYVHEMNQKVRMNIHVEKAFKEFANKIKLEEADSLADILAFSKRAGGDYGKHIRNAAFKIEDRIMVNQEIETITAEKRLELKVMCYMPLGILLYVAITSGDFISPLYGNVAGNAIMTICLIVYAQMVMLGRKIIAIEI